MASRRNILVLYLSRGSQLTLLSGLLIEAWKITKVVDVRVREAPGTLIGYHIAFEGESESIRPLGRPRHVPVGLQLIIGRQEGTLRGREEDARVRQARVPSRLVRRDPAPPRLHRLLL